MRELTRKAYYWLKIIRLSARWVFNYNIGDLVLYNGQIWTLCQGVHAPLWSLLRDGQRVEAYEASFRKVRSLSNYLGSFRSGYRFYMGYWYSIWVNEGIKPWMKGCNIWGKRSKTNE